MKPVSWPSLLSIVLVCGACSDDPSTSELDGGAIDAGPATDATLDGGPPLDCRSPFTLPIPPDAEAKAAAALATLSNTATLTWVAARGTFQSIDGLELPRPTCVGDKLLADELLNAAEATPDLFQLDRADWQADEGPGTCGELAEGTQETVVLRRVKYGPLVERNDVFSAVARKDGGVVVLKFFFATYIPKASPEALALLEGCPDLTGEALETSLLAKPFRAVYSDPPPAPICNLQNELSYQAQRGDTLVVEPESEVGWDDVDPVTIFRVKRAIFTVDPSHFTDELERSTANCPADDLTPRIGWQIIFDAVSGAVLNIVATPVPGCIVC